MSFLRTAASRSLRTALPRAAVPRVAAPRVATASNSFVTWAPTSEPKVSAVQQNPGPPPPPENIGVDAV
jgi:hypothetical protein